MGETKIEWATKVWNPVTGCTPVSAGCKNCYAKRMAQRLRGRYGYPSDDPFKVTLHPDRLDEPLHWRKPRRIFVCSMGDLFHEDVTPEMLAEVWEVMVSWPGPEPEDEPRHIFMVLTKRPENIQRKLDEVADYTGHYWPGDTALGVSLEGRLGFWPPQIWLGVTAENQAAADERIPVLLGIPAAVRFVSVEPMLGPVDLTPAFCPTCQRRMKREKMSKGAAYIVCSNCKHPTLDWVICGGESGPGARPMHPDWARGLRDQCQVAGVPFFFKQWGEHAELKASGFRVQGSVWMTAHNFADGTQVWRMGKKAAGRLLDGKEHNELPEGK